MAPSATAQKPPHDRDSAAPAQARLELEADHGLVMSQPSRTCHVINLCVAFSQMANPALSWLGGWSRHLSACKPFS